MLPTLAAQNLTDLLGALGLPTDDMAQLWLRLEAMRPLRSGEAGESCAATVVVMAHWRAASLRSATVDQMAFVSPQVGWDLLRACQAAGLAVVNNWHGGHAA